MLWLKLAKYIIYLVSNLVANLFILGAAVAASSTNRLM